jgi:DNA-binding response OmpR family regulator
MTKEKILILDDDPDISMMIKMMLEYKGFSVAVAERAEKMEEVLPHDKFNLIIMDMLLSGVNGVDICMKLKKDQQYAHIPIIMISAHPNAKTVCLDAGADHFVAKPFDMEEMLSAIRRVV